MLDKKTLQFLKDIKVNNSREWFEANKNKFSIAKDDFEYFVSQLLLYTSKFDKDVNDLDVKKCTFRQYRDVRFSKDKRPYKINMGAYINRGGKKSIFAGYYFHLEPGNKSFTGGGLWVPMASELKKVRQEIDYCFEEFWNIVNHHKFKKIYKDLNDGEQMKLKTTPKGYTIDNPAIEFLKHKSLVAMKPIPDSELLRPDLIKNTIEAFKALKPLLDFINRSIE